MVLRTIGNGSDKVVRECIFLICMFAYYNFALVACKESAKIFFWSSFGTP